MHIWALQAHRPSQLSPRRASTSLPTGRGIARVATQVVFEQPLLGRRPEDLHDPLSRWRPMLVPDTALPNENDEGGGDTADELRPSDQELGSDHDAGAAGYKRKTSASDADTDPGMQWRAMKSMFLDELLRHEGLGDAWDAPACSFCHVELGHSQCHHCVKRAHQLLPFHHLDEWNGRFWVKTSLCELGLVVQLGHGGFPCPFPDVFVRNMTVIDAPLIHTIRLRYCACNRSHNISDIQQLLRYGWYPATVIEPRTCTTFRTLQAFRLYNVVGNLNVTDFVAAMERMTNAMVSSGLFRVPERTRQMQRMTRQWAFLTRLKRSGCAHNPNGLEKLELGVCAVVCWACPHDKRNLPSNWREAAPEYQFLYMLLIAADANFRLKNRVRPNEKNDPPYGPGLAYWVDPNPYEGHVKKYISEVDISTCMAFAALMQKDTRFTTGLRVSGVGGCLCARHECVRPNGLGDLQKGERYCNMDWIIFSAIMTLTVIFVTLAYDIACQWRINVAERMKRLPPSMQQDLSEVKLQSALPDWHALAHKPECRSENKMALKPGVGKTDGEAAERNTLQRRLVVARDELERQQTAFDAVSGGVEPDLQLEWTRQIRAWEKDSAKPNPYVVKNEDSSTAATRGKGESDFEGRAAIAGGSATSFITAGIQIEDSQQRLHAHIKAPALLTANHELRTEELRRSLLKRIGRFRDLQRIYMPGAAAVLAAAENQRDNRQPSPTPECIRLYMPSQMPRAAAGDEPFGSLPGLLAIEERQRVAQCENSLSKLRGNLHARRWLIAHRNANLVGQRQTTKSAKLLENMAQESQLIADRYRCGYEALRGLGSLGRHPQLRLLEADDIRLESEADYEGPRRAA
ncbi:CxC2 domain-containing protein [Mycena kentingensis (nom. inval.)]|nr:CxC2 domain-containing protein [Mycena kentingensis (nom. inval.)]